MFTITAYPFEHSLVVHAAWLLHYLASKTAVQSWSSVSIKGVQRSHPDANAVPFLTLSAKFQQDRINNTGSSVAYSTEKTFQMFFNLQI